MATSSSSLAAAAAAGPSSPPSHFFSSPNGGAAAAVASSSPIRRPPPPSPLSSTGHPPPAEYDWSSEDNLCRWRGIFMVPLEKVLRQVHPQLLATEDALAYVESLVLRLLALMTARPAPTTVADIESRVSRTFPTPIDKWALAVAQEAVAKGRKKASIVFPVDKVQHMLKEVLQNSKVDEQVSLFLVAVVEYISADILKLAGNYVKNFNFRQLNITCQDIKTAMCADKVLMDMFQQDHAVLGGEVLAVGAEVAPSSRRSPQTYDEVVRDLIMDEKQYLRDLHMITKVFKEILQRDCIGSTTEINDTLEMTEENYTPAIGPCFEELAEAEEFDVYEKYARDTLSPTCRRTLETLLPKQIVSEALRSCGKGFREAVRFYLPKLLLGPIYHCFGYFNYIEVLRKLSVSKEEGDTLTQVASIIAPLKNKLKQLVQNAGPAAKRKPGDLFHRLGPSRTSRRQQSLQKLNQLQQSIANWEGPDLSANSSEIICEGKLKVLEKARRPADRYVILCDGMILVCKQISGKRSSVTSSSQSYEYRLREKHLIRKVDVLDRDDGGESFTFELVPREQPKVIFKAESEEEKNSWMAALVMLNTKSMLERLLDVILMNEEQKHPLRFPPVHRYRFAELDSDKDNIVFEDKAKSSGVPLIKGATLVKLVERLTYHVYADPTFMKTFLTTYRSFCTPHELLDLLIDRFNIPDPEFSSDSESDSEISSSSLDKSSKLRAAQDLKRFRQQYSQPVQFRVLNVLKYWVNQHFYDFEQDELLLEKLNTFLNGVSCKSMKKWVDCIVKIVHRRVLNEDKDKDITIILDRSPPPIEQHLEEQADEAWPPLLAYHPIEIARQLTLLEFQYYRAVKPSELVDQAWTREDKDKRSPNLLRMVRHTTNFTRYLEKMIVETENLEERTAVMQRTLEIMVVLQELNNFNGVLAITSAINSSAVHRLANTKDRIPNNLLKHLDDASSYISDHFRVYWEKLRSINPPCVPFFGQYQTNILFLEEGNPDFLHNSPNLINFTKRRKVAEIISEIQQYQNQSYCLSPYLSLKTFLEEIDPFPGMSEKEVTDYLWAKSIEIEPRGTGAEQRKRTDGKPKWKGLSLRSPGTKPKSFTGKKDPPNPLRIKPHSSSSRNNSDIDSPLTSPGGGPSGGRSPPVTPLQLLSSTSTNSPPDSSDTDPVKYPVMLPHQQQAAASSAATSAASSPPPPPPVAAVIPPPLPPKPRQFFDHHHHQPLPPLLPPPSGSSSSPPPPPLPPRRDATGIYRNSQRPPPPPPPPAAVAAAARKVI